MELKNLLTQIETRNYKAKIHHKDGIVSVGSCFSTEIGHELSKLEFDILVNPFGTLFNPISIFNLIKSCITLDPINMDQIVIQNGLYYHYQWHSSVYGQSEEELIAKINAIKEYTNKKLKNCKHLILTFGSALVHEYKTDIVANCHKQPKRMFKRRFLNNTELIKAFTDFYAVLTHHNPDIRIITTTSPIRHIKEGLVDNNRSKSILNIFNMYLEDTYIHLDYFPSYEILMDVLRDYRFYKADLIHPNKQAIQEVWEHFLNELIHPESCAYISMMKKYNQMCNHNVMFPESESGKLFEEKKKKLYQEIYLLK